MYLLNKQGTLCSICIRGLFLSKKFSTKNKKQNLIFLRSPKHFNVGKQKIISFNNKKNYLLNVHYHYLTKNIIKNYNNIFNFLVNNFKLNLLFRINSINISYKCKIK